MCLQNMGGSQRLAARCVPTMPCSPNSSIACHCCRNVTNVDVGQQSWTLADLGGQPGEFTFSVVAENANGQGQDATTPPLIVGTPGAPTWAASNPVVAAPGTARLTWTAPAYNAQIGTRYYVQLWRDNGATKFGGLVALAPTGASPFTATINVTAGV